MGVVASGARGVLTPRIREVQFSDAAGVVALLERNDVTHETPEQWAELWRTNPVLRDHPSLPMGWVLDAGGDVVGYLGSVPLRYRLDRRPLLAAAARGFAVDAAQRQHSLHLAAAFFSQKDVELFLNTTANAAAGSVFQLCKAEHVPQPNADQAFFWITNARRFAASVLRKRGASSSAAALGAPLLGAALRFESAFRRRGPQRAAVECRVHPRIAENIAADLEALWRRVLDARPTVLLADRSPQTMRWHFERSSDAHRQPRFISAHRDGTLAGYAVVVRADAPDIGLRRLRIADLLAERDDPQTIDALCAAAFAEARRSSDVLEVTGFSGGVMSRAVEGRAMQRALPSWPYWYKARSRDLHARLRDGEAWYAGPYDGDATL